ncbi:MAG: phosphatase PAP2 family protein [Lachnospiraceae bacterium]|jgi:membrane-associated phospholipid phosphatase
MITQFEQQILLWVQENLRTDGLNKAASAISDLGHDGIFWILLTAALLLTGLALKFFRSGKYSCHMPVRVSCAGGLGLILSLIITNLTLKKIIARPRPFAANPAIEYVGTFETDTSFPSGHASASFACAVAILIVLPKEKKWIGVVLVVIASLISLSRIYLGMHYPSDVIAGVLVGVLCGVIAARIVKTVAGKAGGKKQKN